MSQKKIVSIEDRIPKLKQERKKKANRRLIFYLSIFFVLISIVVYLQSSLSQVHYVEVYGNNYVADQDITTLSEITTNDNFWSVSKESSEQRVGKHPEIKEVSISKKFPTTIIINVQEFERIGYVKKDNSYFPLLEDGLLLTSQSLNSIKGDAPLLTNFNKQTYLEELIGEIQNLPESIVDLISEISWAPTEGNPYKILMYMNDGFEVEGSIRNLSKTMKSYPSIVGQLDPDSEGIIHIGVGAYFESYRNNEEVEPTQEENQDEVEG
ncbi:FtsQ-type POTRA domain-containing protein [Aquibacillus halophilus]|uniref:Cell division protein DivIB n=1 Tax=Aquibacillus halophilus TaxID=930132 RepID=A0A6A8DGZ4_9BACI|nr:FtsQ-type POTRA domain-containing protein [Aquibacillus halophilus]MRH42167.1 FtsQ-type POTRA domain-containing protein [Aquibacillus halophilus]